MTVEYILLVALFLLFLGRSLIPGPFEAFDGYAPKLGARVESHLMTGDGFYQTAGGQPAPNEWAEPNSNAP